MFADEEIWDRDTGCVQGVSAIARKRCTVNTVAYGSDQLPLHGSKSAIADGSVVNGPASRPLAEREITVSGDTIQLA